MEKLVFNTFQFILIMKGRAFSDCASGAVRRRIEVAMNSRKKLNR